MINFTCLQMWSFESGALADFLQRLAKCHGAQSHRKANGSHTSTVLSTQIGRSGSGRCRYEAFWHTHTWVRKTGWVAWRQWKDRLAGVDLQSHCDSVCQRDFADSVNDYIDYSSYTCKTMYDRSHFIIIKIQCCELRFYFFFRSYLLRSFILSVGAGRQPAQTFHSSGHLVLMLFTSLCFCHLWYHPMFGCHSQWSKE